MISRVAAAAALALAACSSPSPPRYSSSTPTQVLTTLDSAGIRDLRAVYRGAVCHRLPAAGPRCDDVLLALADEAGAPATLGRPGAHARYRIGVVPGLLAECFDGMIRPFAEAMDALARAGFVVHYLPVAGRGSADHNAAELAEKLAALPADPRPLILIALSKGLPDALSLVARYPQTASSVAAIVSVAGAMNGSPLADRLNPAFREWVSALPMPRCRRGDGEEFEDLRREVRLAWWQRHRTAVTAPVFSLVTTPRPDRLSPILKEMYDKLAEIEPRNDGQLIWYDQLVPGGYLLGYVNADHWSIAVAPSHKFPAWRSCFATTSHAPRCSRRRSRWSTACPRRRASHSAAGSRSPHARTGPAARMAACGPPRRSPRRGRAGSAPSSARRKPARSADRTRPTGPDSRR